MPMVGGGASKLLMLFSTPSSFSSSHLRLLLCSSSSTFALRLHPLSRSQFVVRPFSVFSSDNSVLPPSSSSSSLGGFAVTRALSSESFQIEPALKDDFLVGGFNDALLPRWSEWEKLLDDLRTRGYFDASSGPLVHGDHEEDVLSDINRLPGDFVAAIRACLAFARDHPDVVRSLPKKDVEMIVENEPPSLFHNISSSVSRIRVFLGNDQENAQTVDVMRVLLCHVHNSVIAIGQKDLQGREPVEASICKLLHTFIQVCGTIESKIPDSMSRQFSSAKGQTAMPLGQNIVMKRGDWICSKCSFMNFARNVRCRGCSEARPRRQLNGGEWECPQCDFFNYGRNTVCLRCDCRRPVDTLFGSTPKSDLDSKNPERSDLEAKLAENDEKAQRWFSKVSQLDDGSVLSSAITDDDFPEIMPLRKGVNRFVVSTRKTPLERRLANTQYRRNLNNCSAEENGSQNDGSSKSLNEILGPSLSSASPSSLSSAQHRQRFENEGNDSGYLPFTPLPADMFAKTKDTFAEARVTDDKAGIASDGTHAVSAEGNIGVSGGSNVSVGPEKVGSEPMDPSERWFKKVAELHDVSDLASAIPDEEFPEIMPLPKGENRFVINKKKDRSLTSPQYKRRLAMQQANNSNFVPFVPFPPDYFAKKDKPESDTPNSGAAASTDGETTGDSMVSVNDEKVTGIPKESKVSENVNQQTQQANVSENNLNKGSGVSNLDGSVKIGVFSSRGDAQQIGNDQANTRENRNSGFFTGKSLEGSAVKEIDPLDMSEEAKAERWFRRVAQIKDISELSNIPDEDFPTIMPMRKGVNRFVVSKRKTPLERRLTSPQYRRNLPVVSSEPEKDTS